MSDFTPISESEAGELLEGATPGAWGVVDSEHQMVRAVSPTGGWLNVARAGRTADAALIAAAPRLAETVVIAEGVVKRLLDGWEVMPDADGWQRVTYSYIGNPPERATEPMSPSEVAYIKEVGGNG